MVTILIVCPSGKFKNDRNASDYMWIRSVSGLSVPTSSYKRSLKYFVLLDEFVRADPNQIDRRYIKGKLGPNQLLSDFGVDNVNDDKGHLQIFKKYISCLLTSPGLQNPSTKTT